MMYPSKPKKPSYRKYFPILAFLWVMNSYAAVTYTLGQVANPTADEKDAYAKIKIAMDSATLLYTTYTVISKKLYVSYNTSVATADGNINGSIRFGKNRAYMVCATAMHEIGHTVGVGTCAAWPKLIVGGSYIGQNATRAYRSIVKDTTAVLHGDRQHFWPYGINYAAEAKSTADLINHCRIVDAMQKDFYPSSICASTSGNDRGGHFFSIDGAGRIVFFETTRQCFAEIALYTLSGRKAAIIESGTFGPGGHAVALNFGTVSAGAYECRLTAGEHRETRSFVLMRNSR